nr:hypothetical protein CFP56_04025 [Quercus suber]
MGARHEAYPGNDVYFLVTPFVRHYVVVDHRRAICCCPFLVLTGTRILPQIVITSAHFYASAIGSTSLTGICGSYRGGINSWAVPSDPTSRQALLIGQMISVSECKRSDFDQLYPTSSDRESILCISLRDRTG